MRKIILTAAIGFLSLITNAQNYGNTNTVYVRSYTTSNGTQVNSHYRTTPDYTRNNNWSTVGNVNPYTGKEGTKSGGYNYTPSSYSSGSSSSRRSSYYKY